MLTKNRVAALAAGALIAASPVASNPASAHVDEYRSRVTLDVARKLRGRVVSKRPSCERGRKVKVFEVRDGADRLVGRDKAGRRGRWNVPRDGKGSYYAKVVRKDPRGGYEHVHSCKADKSMRVEVG